MPIIETAKKRVSLLSFIESNQLFGNGDYMSAECRYLREDEKKLNIELKDDVLVLLYYSFFIEFSLEDTTHFS